MRGSRQGSSGVCRRCCCGRFNLSGDGGTDFHIGNNFSISIRTGHGVCGKANISISGKGDTGVMGNPRSNFHGPHMSTSRPETDGISRGCRGIAQQVAYGTWGVRVWCVFHTRIRSKGTSRRAGNNPGCPLLFCWGIGGYGLSRRRAITLGIIKLFVLAACWVFEEMNSVWSNSVLAFLGVQYGY